MKASKACIDLIKRYEGCRLVAYKPVAAEPYMTIGYGHYGPDVAKGMRITQEQADAYLVQDIVKYENAVNNLKRYWTQGQFDALVSFTYNCGAGSLRALTNGRTAAVIAEKMLLYNKGANKVVLPGLVRRRAEERALFLSDGLPKAVVSTTGYEVGKIYKTTTAVKIRKGPGTKYKQVKHTEMDVAEIMFDPGKVGCIDKGLSVAPREVQTEGANVWLRIGSGWVCAKYGNKTYIR